MNIHFGLHSEADAFSFFFKFFNNAFVMESALDVLTDGNAEAIPLKAKRLVLLYEDKVEAKSTRGLAGMRAPLELAQFVRILGGERKDRRRTLLPVRFVINGGLEAIDPVVASSAPYRPLGTLATTFVLRRRWFELFAEITSGQQRRHGQLR